MNERELLVDCLQRLNRSGVSYYLTDSMASNYWGIPRTTHDLDFVVQLPPGVIPRLVQEFQSGFYIDEEAVRTVYEPPHQFNAIDTRSALKVDFWLAGTTALDQEALDRRVEVTIFGERAWVGAAEDVILHKLAWSRQTPSDRQMGDAAGIIAVQAEALNREYMERWTRELGVESDLRRLLSGEIRPKNT